ncbi:hypothetical protein ACIOWK_32615 [Pseudomonas protegens]|uniref:hypothetical protein n=1 Tax=Pseudomonas protegens TaxID=380021 RepID=UPI0037F45D67
MEIDWREAPAHATHWCPGNAKIEAGWVHYSGGQRGEFYSCYANKGLEHIPDFPEWRKSRLIPRPSEATWTGEGLPPVGAALEAGFACEGFKIWHRGVCVAVGEDPEGREDFCVVQFGKKLAQYSVEGRRMRPIRTPEQIAAEEREKIVKEMQAVVQSAELGYMKGLYALYDAGYRKFEIVDGDA